jgi:hypothetical protein
MLQGDGVLVTMRAAALDVPEDLERATGIEPVLPAWESISGALYFQYLQNGLGKINVHATHTVHAVPELRVVAGRLRDGVSVLMGTKHSSGSSEWLIGMRSVKDDVAPRLARSISMPIALTTILRRPAWAQC